MTRHPETIIMENKKEWTRLMSMTAEQIRNLVVGLDEEVLLADGSRRPLINFDNAATTPAFKPVLETVCRELAMYGSIGRGFSRKSDYSTDLVESVRMKILRFVGAEPDEYTCFFANNATDGLNKLASALITDPDDVVLTTRMEHHSNDLPWRERCRVLYAETDKSGRIDYDEIEKLLQENDVKYVTVTAASNVTGYITDIHRVAGLAHKYDAKIIVDGAQIISHRNISMPGDTPEEDLDFFVFSSHKMYAPFGSGAVVGLKSVLNNHRPAVRGGGTVWIVADDWQKYKDAPAVYEAGFPNFPGIVALGKAIDMLSEIGYDSIFNHEQLLIKKLLDGLKRFDDVILYGDAEDISGRVGVVSFNFPGINSYFLAQTLSEKCAIATRRGAFCAHPYVWRLMDIPYDDLSGFVKCDDANTPGMVRVSFGIYNTEEEVDRFLQGLSDIKEEARLRTEESPYHHNF